jgi:hypothetical protein
MTSKNVRVVTIGGRVGEKIDTSSFAGGGVVKSDDCMWHAFKRTAEEVGNG